jgi:hypothetical protein
MKKRWLTFVQECGRIPRFIVTISDLALIWSILLVPVGSADAATQTMTLTISGQNNVVISGLTISTTRGDCIDIVNSRNVTIQASQVGPCGTSNSTGSSRGISISGASYINVYDSYIHVENLAAVCDDSHDGIYITETTGPVTLQGNVIAFNQNNVRVNNASNVAVIGNFLLNTRGSASCSFAPNLKGHSFQAWADNTSAPNLNIAAVNNYVLASHEPQYKFPGAASDYINFGVTNGVLAQDNWVGGDPTNTDQNACGIIADFAANSAQFINNVVSNTFNCGISIGSGTNQTVSGNKVVLLPPTAGGASGITVANYYSVPCGPVSISNNIAYTVQPSGWLQSFYNYNCGPITQTNNTWDRAAFNMLYPIDASNPPPLVPPQPFSCVATSPYSTQTSAPPCSGSGSGLGSAPPTEKSSPSPTGSLPGSRRP